MLIASSFYILSMHRLIPNSLKITNALGVQIGDLLVKIVESDFKMYPE